MTTSTTVTTSLATASLVDAEKMCNGIMGIVQAFKADISRLELDDKKLLEGLADAKREEETAGKKLTELLTKSESSGPMDDEYQNTAPQENLNGMEEYGGPRYLVVLKRKYDEMQKRIVDILDNHSEKERSLKDHQMKMRMQICHLERMEKLQLESQQKRQKIQKPKTDSIKAQQDLEKRHLTSYMESTDLGNLKGDYIFVEKPLKAIPHGMIQVSRATADRRTNRLSDGPPREDEDSCFLYVVRDQYKCFKKFTALAESVFGLDTDHIKHLKGTKSKFLLYNEYSEDKLKAIANKWEKEASQKDNLYILKGEYPYGSNTVYYVE
ncbi:hypothetical protein BZA77DRAFT_79881 [Pyronema omphalodes]|nr:hypothetical protein BZA77DRAFT_79881 [Pyronema omphalodes]